MTLQAALKRVTELDNTATGEPVLRVNDFKAAESLGAYLNMIGCTGAVYGKFTDDKQRDYWEVSLAQLTEDAGENDKEDK